MADAATTMMPIPTGNKKPPELQSTPATFVPWSNAFVLPSPMILRTPLVLYLLYHIKGQHLLTVMRFIMRPTTHASIPTLVEKVIQRERKTIGTFALRNTVVEIAAIYAVLDKKIQDVLLDHALDIESLRAKCLACAKMLGPKIVKDAATLTRLEAAILLAFVPDSVSSSSPPTTAKTPTPSGVSASMSSTSVGANSADPSAATASAPPKSKRAKKQKTDSGAAAAASSSQMTDTGMATQDQQAANSDSRVWGASPTAATAATTLHNFGYNGLGPEPVWHVDFVVLAAIHRRVLKFAVGEPAHVQGVIDLITMYDTVSDKHGYPPFDLTDPSWRTGDTLANKIRIMAEEVAMRDRVTLLRAQQEHQPNMSSYSALDCAPPTTPTDYWQREDASLPPLPTIDAHDSHFPSAVRADASSVSFGSSLIPNTLSTAAVAAGATDMCLATTTLPQLPTLTAPSSSSSSSSSSFSTSLSFSSSVVAAAATLAAPTAPAAPAAPAAIATLTAYPIAENTAASSSSSTEMRDDSLDEDNSELDASKAFDASYVQQSGLSALCDDDYDL